MDFKSLNTAWKELLLSSLFAIIHQLSLTDDFQIFVQSYSMFKINNLEGIECSRGMLCCLCRTNDLDYTYLDFTFIIMNPVIGICTTISESLSNVNMFGVLFLSKFV
ncbi:hypothetical protein AMTRI_Chr04g246780 [Amborella trichopoda]